MSQNINKVEALENAQLADFVYLLSNDIGNCKTLGDIILKVAIEIL